MSRSRIRVALTVTAAVVLAAGCARKDTSRRGEGGSPQVIEMEVTSAGFVPAEVEVKAGEPVKLVITRRTEKTCATDFVMKDLGIRKALPLDQPVEIVFTPEHRGTIRYACAMDMVSGQLDVR